MEQNYETIARTAYEKIITDYSSLEEQSDLATELWLVTKLISLVDEDNKTALGREVIKEYVEKMNEVKSDLTKYVEELKGCRQMLQISAEMIKAGFFLKPQEISEIVEKQQKNASISLGIFTDMRPRFLANANKKFQAAQQLLEASHVAHVKTNGIESTLPDLVFVHLTNIEDSLKRVQVDLKKIQQQGLIEISAEKAREIMREAIIGKKSCLEAANSLTQEISR